MLEYSKNYSKSSGSLWNYYRDESNGGLGGENNNVNYSIKDSKSFGYKKMIAGKLAGIDTTKEAEKVVPLKYLSNFWKTIDMPLINCEVSLTLTWSGKCVLTRKATRDAVPAQGGNPAVAAVKNPTNAAFVITHCKLYAPVVTLSAESDNTLLKQLKAGFNEHGINIDQKCIIRLKITI